jgi:hypothetical protein
VVGKVHGEYKAFSQKPAANQEVPMPDDNDHRSRVCKRSTTMRAQCDTCGTVPAVIHIPLFLHGWFCPVHCPECNAPGGSAPKPLRPPTVIRAGKFSGVEIAALSLDDLREAHRGTSRDDGAMQRAIAAERRRRWRARRRGNRFSKRQRARYAMRWGVAAG